VAPGSELSLGEIQFCSRVEVSRAEEEERLAARPSSRPNKENLVYKESLTTTTIAIILAADNSQSQQGKF
jgi:hypothetical protein